MPVRRSAILAAVLLLTGCVTPIQYSPAYGQSEAQLESDRKECVSAAFATARAMTPEVRSASYRDGTFLKQVAACMIERGYDVSDPKGRVGGIAEMPPVPKRPSQ